VPPRPSSGAQPDYTAAAELRLALRRLAHATEQITRRHGLTPRRYELLLFVQSAEDAGAPATVGSLADTLLTAQGSVTQLVNGAVKAGLLRRRPLLTDRRSHHLHVTPAGQKRMLGVYLELGAERDRLAEIVDAHLLPAARSRKR
jgi:DNA-binding MarR family transcriptional regulator